LKLFHGFCKKYLFFLMALYTEYKQMPVLSPCYNRSNALLGEKSETGLIIDEVVYDIW
jgi:hypothetical protein